MWKPLVGTMLVALIAATPIDASEVDPVCIAKIKSVVQAAAQEATQRMNDIEFDFHDRTQEIDLTHKQPEVIKESDWRVSLWLAKKRWIINSHHAGQGGEGMRVMNENYKFWGGQSVDGKGYKIGAASKNDAKTSVNPLGDKYLIVANIIEASWAWLGLIWEQALTSPDYRIVVAKFIGEGSADDRPIRLEVQYIGGSTSTDPRKVPAKGARYWVELGPVPGASLMIKRCGYKDPAGMEFTRDVEYQPYGQGAFPKTIVVNAMLAKFKYVNKQTLTVGEPRLCTRTDAEFYLPYYGIPESVVDVTWTSSWVRTAAIVLSLMGVAVSIYFYRLSRKPSGPKTAPG